MFSKPFRAFPNVKMMVRDRIKDILRIKFIRDVGFLQISTIITALITMITSLIIAKELGPADFGIYSLAFSLYCLASMLGNLGVKQTVLVKLSSAFIRQDKEETLYLLAYYFKISLIIGILIIIFGHYLAPYLSRLLYGREDIGRLSRILFYISPLIILYKLITVSLEGTRSMDYLAITECLAALIKSITLITLVALGLGLTILIYGWLISAIALSIMAIVLYKALGLTKKGLPSLTAVLKKIYFVDIRLLFKFNLSMGLSENIITLSENLPVILLGIFILPKEVGYFKLGYSVMGISTLFLEPSARNLLVKLRELQANRDIKGLSKTFYRVSLYAGVGSTILITLIIVLYLFLVCFLLKDYQLSLKIIYPLAIYFCLIGFGIGLSPILRALERLDIEIKINALGLLVFIALSISLIKNLGILGMTIALAVSSLFTKLTMYIWVKNQLNKLEIL